VSGQRLQGTREHCNERVLHRANMRAIALTTRDASCIARRKCLTFTREYVSMHVMEHSNAAVARGEKVSPSGFATANRTKRTVFTGCNMQTAEAIEIAASEDMKLTASAAGSCPP
jgi:ferredoxin